MLIRLREPRRAQRPIARAVAVARVVVEPERREYLPESTFQLCPLHRPKLSHFAHVPNLMPSHCPCQSVVYAAVAYQLSPGWSSTTAGDELVNVTDKRRGACTPALPLRIVSISASS